MTLTAPFPYYGGKRRWSERVWERLGEPTVYVEPCAGSLAVLLSKPGGPAPREIVCDTDGHICNFWRAVQSQPERVAEFSDWPTIHQDLTARHRYLKQWARDHAHRLSEDPNYCDPDAAGWWVWGISLWIGGGWCTGDLNDKRPQIQPKGGSQGVSRQRTPDKVPHSGIKTGGRGVSRQVTIDQIPAVANWTGGQGVARQRVRDQIPHVNTTSGAQGVARQRTVEQIPYVNSMPGGRGVSKQRIHTDRLIDWFHALQERLANVIVLNRSWESAVTPTLMQHTNASPKPPAAIFFDPPYVQTERDAILYNSDMERTSDDVATAIYRWCTEPGGITIYPDTPPGEVYRIAYCCHEGDFAVPEGWSVEYDTFKGIHVENRRTRRDCVMFSPACIQPQTGLFDEWEDA